MRKHEQPLPDPPTNDRPSDRWMCGRSGEPCSRGPIVHGTTAWGLSMQGTCPMASPCQPQATWSGLRRRASLLAIAATMVLLAVLIRYQQRAAVAFKPGELATPHAQILAGTLASNRCATCHPQSAISPSDWFSSETAAHAGVTQADRCLDCHHTTMVRSKALLAHNLTRSARAEIKLASQQAASDTWHDLLPGPKVDQENVQCSVCHQEHQGADADLLAISNAQCQTCHADRFGSFATSHPDWRGWPYGRGQQLAFNHASHANQHFPATVQGKGTAQFHCSDCHQKRENHELTRSTSYERACQSCHDKALQLEAAEGVELLALPTLPESAAAKMAAWPESATGFYDGKVSPLADLLMRSDDEFSDAIRLLTDGDFSRIDDSNPEVAQAAETVARAHHEFMQLVSVEGQEVIFRRAEALGVSRNALFAFARSLSPQLVGEADRRWFLGSPLKHVSQQHVESESNSKRAARHGVFSFAAHPRDDDALLDDDDLLGDDALLGDTLLGDTSLGNDTLLGGGDPLEIDPLAIDPLSTSTESIRGNETRFEPDAMMPAGGWYRDDLRMAIRYRGGGHADPVLCSVVEMISQLPASDVARKNLLKNRAIASCVSCHPGAVRVTGAWKSEPLIGRRQDFTKFAHGPHLNVAQLADCVHCHKIQKGSVVTQSFAGGSVLDLENDAIQLTSGGLVDSHDFLPLTRQDCGVCHTAKAAGDGCIKCHRYHIDLR